MLLQFDQHLYKKFVKHSSGLKSMRGKSMLSNAPILK